MLVMLLFKFELLFECSSMVDHYLYFSFNCAVVTKVLNVFFRTTSPLSHSGKCTGCIIVIRDYWSETDLARWKVVLVTSHWIFQGRFSTHDDNIALQAIWCMIFGRKFDDHVRLLIKTSVIYPCAVLGWSYCKS